MNALRLLTRNFPLALTLLAGAGLLAPAPADAALLYVTGGTSRLRTVDTVTGAFASVPVTGSAARPSACEGSTSIPPVRCMSRI